MCHVNAARGTLSSSTSLIYLFQQDFHATQPVIFMFERLINRAQQLLYKINTIINNYVYNLVDDYQLHMAHFVRELV